MVLVLPTFPNDGRNEDARTACAVIPVTTDTLDYLLGLMDQAAQLSDTLGKTITLGCADWLPTWYATWPPETALSEADGEALEAGQPCLLATSPFPDPDEGVDSTEAPFLCPPREGEPVRLAYCELRLTADTLTWWCGPKYGTVEEYTAEVTRALLEALTHCVAPQASP